MPRGRKRKKSSTLLVVCAAFEPSRLAEGCMAEAYEHAIPVARRTTRSAPSSTMTARRSESLGEGTGP
ncbi:MAG: hypothetical protein M3R38_13100 [Actinomycetota bacterium]|nr:hypothetical protein [Actinomycetota bacterium]